MLIENGQPARDETDLRLEKQQVTPQATPEQPKPETVDPIDKEPAERRAFLHVANELLTDGKIDEETLALNNRELIEAVQEKFQEELMAHYQEMGISDKVKALKVQESLHPSGKPLDEQALNLIAQLSEGTHGWVDMLPALRNRDKDAGLNCTLGSAMLHLALEELGFPRVKTVLRKGHHIVLRELDNNTVKLYDPTSLSTVNDQLVGYTKTYSRERIVDRQPVRENDQRVGYTLKLLNDGPEEIGGFYEPDSEGRYTQDYYVYHPSVKMDLAIALENLSEIKDDAVKVETGTTEAAFNMDEYKGALVEYLKRNNQNELTDDSIDEIVKQNRQTIEELLQEADKAFEEQRQGPNPYQYIKSPLLVPKSTLETPPDPIHFQGSSERYEQARQLCEAYPELKQLDFKQIKQAFELFDGYDHISLTQEQIDAVLEQAESSEVPAKLQSWLQDKINATGRVLFGSQLAIDAWSAVGFFAAIYHAPTPVKVALGAANIARLILRRKMTTKVTPKGLDAGYGSLSPQVQSILNQGMQGYARQ